MCGRYVSATPLDVLVDWFEIDEVRTEELAPSWNVAPTDPVYAVVERDATRLLGAFGWGLVPPGSSGHESVRRPINARAETVADRPAFRAAFARGRCLVPADGFYEWRSEPGGAKQGFFISPRDGRPMAFAGLWSTGRDRDGLRTCTVVTTAANTAVRALHDRMPVILPRASWDEWLDPDEHDPLALTRLLVPASEDLLEVRAVGSRVNSVRNNGPELIEPTAP